MDIQESRAYASVIYILSLGFTLCLCSLFKPFFLDRLFSPSVLCFYEDIPMRFLWLVISIVIQVSISLCLLPLSTFYHLFLTFFCVVSQSCAMMWFFLLSSLFEYHHFLSAWFKGTLCPTFLTDKPACTRCAVSAASSLQTEAEAATTATT